MLDKKSVPVYDEQTIKTLSSLEHIRLRPGMYIGRIGDGSNPVNGLYSFNFFGNFVWCRAHITNFSAGNINRVLYNT